MQDPGRPICAGAQNTPLQRAELSGFGCGPDRSPRCARGRGPRARYRRRPQLADKGRGSSPRSDAMRVRVSASSRTSPARTAESVPARVLIAHSGSSSRSTVASWRSSSRRRRRRFWTAQWVRLPRIIDSLSRWSPLPALPPSSDLVAVRLAPQHCLANSGSPVYRVAELTRNDRASSRVIPADHECASAPRNRHDGAATSVHVTHFRYIHHAGPRPCSRQAAHAAR